MQPVWQNRAIATHKLRLLEFTAYVEQQREQQESYNKHHFVHIAGPVSYSDPLLEVNCIVDHRAVQRAASPTLKIRLRQDHA